MNIFRRIARAVRRVFTSTPPPPEPPREPALDEDAPETLFGPPIEGPDYTWTVAGYVGSDGFTYNVEAGDPEPSDRDLELGGRVIVLVTDRHGIDHYYTILGALTPDYGIAEAIEDIRRRYGGEFV